MFKRLDNLDFAEVIFKPGIVNCRLGLLVKFGNSHHANIHFIRLYRSIFVLSLVMSPQKEVLAVELTIFGVRLTDG